MTEKDDCESYSETPELSLEAVRQAYEAVRQASMIVSIIHDVVAPLQEEPLDT